MKTCLFCLLLFVFSLPVMAQDDVKVIAEMVSDFSTATPSNTVQVKLYKEYKINDNLILEKDSILKGNLTKVHNPKHFLRDAYFRFDPISYSIPSKNNQEILIGDKDLHVRSLGYNNLDPSKVMEYAATTVVDFVVPGISPVVGLLNGFIYAEEGQNKVKNAIVTAYNESWFGLINKGEHIELTKGDIIYLKFYKFKDDKNNSLDEEQKDLKDRIELISVPN